MSESRLRWIFWTYWDDSISHKISNPEPRIENGTVNRNRNRESNLKPRIEPGTENRTRNLVESRPEPRIEPGTKNRIWNRESNSEPIIEPWTENQLNPESVLVSLICPSTTAFRVKNDWKMRWVAWWPARWKFSFFLEAFNIAMNWIWSLSSSLWRSIQLYLRERGGGGGGEPKNEALFFQSTVEIHLQNAHKTHKPAKLCVQWRSEGPACRPREPGGRGWRGPQRARQEKVVAVNPWPGAQTSCLRGGENHRYATVCVFIVVHFCSKWLFILY